MVLLLLENLEIIIPRKFVNVHKLLLVILVQMYFGVTRYIMYLHWLLYRNMHGSSYQDVELCPQLFFDK